MSESSSEGSSLHRPLRQDLRFLAGIVGVGLVVALVLGGLMLAVRSPGDKQVSFVSHEVVFGDPGGRVYFYPKRQSAILKAWSLLSLEPSRTYQVWAVETGKPRSLALSQSSGILELDLFLHTDLSQAESVIVTVEPARGSTVPTGSPALVMSR